MSQRLLKKRPRLGGAIYVLPNLLTTGNLYFGFFSIVKSMHQDFAWASAAILLAAIFDILDGRVARLTDSASEFGVQYDSLCDLVSFGLAPAFLMYQYKLSELGRIGWILCFIFLACGSLRLARFNVQSVIGQASDDFTGLPIPMAAGVIASFVAFESDLLRDGLGSLPWVEWLKSILIDECLVTCFLVVYSPILAMLMVSNLRYRSHKSINPRSIKPFRMLAVLVVVLGFGAYRPELAGFLFFWGYSLSGIVEWVLGWKKAHEEGDIFVQRKQGASIMEPDSSDRNVQE